MPTRSAQHTDASLEWRASHRGRPAPFLLPLCARRLPELGVSVPLARGKHRAIVAAEEESTHYVRLTEAHHEHDRRNPSG